MDESFGLLLESMPEAVVVVNREGEITYCNSKARRILGKDVVSLKVWEIEGLESGEKMRDFIKSLASGRYTKKREVFEFTAGRKIFYLSIYATELLDGSGFILTFRDITPIVESSRRIEELNDVLRLINKLLRHDILNKVTIARANIEILSDEIKSERIPVALEALDEVVELIERARAFEQTLTSGELVEIRLGDVVKEVAEDFSVRGLKVRVEGDASVLADKAIYSVLTNLLENSLKHGKSTEVEIRVEKRGNFAVMVVRDDGKGLPEEVIDRIFEEGFTHGDSAGSGLGLYIVKKVIERYGGEVRACNDGGAVFEIKLKLAT